MKVTVSFMGPIQRPWPEMKREIETESGYTIEDLLLSFGYKPEHLGRVITTINGAKRSQKTLLRTNDELDVILLAGGG